MCTDRQTSIVRCITTAKGITNATMGTKATVILKVTVETI
jgi:hypothetical protein